MIPVLRVFVEVFNIFFVVYLIGYSAVLFAAAIVGSMALFDKWRRNELKNNLPEEHFVPASLLVPAYNEERSILGTVYSLLALEYNIFEIIVISDGSSDETVKVMIEEYNMYEVKRPIRMQVDSSPATAVYEATIGKVQLTLIDKENGGKADALNLGINASRYPYVITIDADTMLDSMALKNIMLPAMEDDDVIAVAGLVRPANDLKIESGKLVKPSMPKNLLACMQAFEYDRSFLSARLLFHKVNAALIISGAFGMYRKKELISVGGLHRDTIGEDMELVVKLHSYCRTQQIRYKIEYASDAVCWTQVPEKVKDFIAQRRRWHVGLFQSLKRYYWILMQPWMGGKLWLTFLYFTIYELASPWIEMIGIATVIVAAMIGLINIPFMLLFMFIYLVYGWSLTFAAFFSRINTTNTGITFGDFVRALTFCLLENTTLRFILLYARLVAFRGYKKRRLSWNKVQRYNVDLSKK